MKLIAASPADFPTLYAALCAAFPENERRDEENARALLDRTDYRLLHIEEAGERIGLFSLFEFEDFRFLEHFAILPEYRNRGLGTRALSLLTDRPVILEAELPTTPIATRRIGFYRRCGFSVNPIEYAQPPYRTGDAPTPMHLLSSPTLLTDPQGAVALIYERVYDRTRRIP